MTVGDIVDVLRCASHYEREAKRDYLEAIRNLVYLQYNMNVQQKDQRSARQLMPFPWDSEEQEKKDKERSKVLAHNMDVILKNRTNGA